MPRYAVKLRSTFVLSIDIDAADPDEAKDHAMLHIAANGAHGLTMVEEGEPEVTCVEAAE